MLFAMFSYDVRLKARKCLFWLCAFIFKYILIEFLKVYLWTSKEQVWGNLISRDFDEIRFIIYIIMIILDRI